MLRSGMFLVGMVLLLLAPSTQAQQGGNLSGPERGILRSVNRLDRAPSSARYGIPDQELLRDRAWPDATSGDQTTSPEATAGQSPGESPPVAAERQSPELTNLRIKIESCLARYSASTDRAEDRSPWGVMHTLIPFGVDTDIAVGGRRVNAIGYLCWNGFCRGQHLFYVTNGQLRSMQGPGVEGHSGQFLAMLAQSRVKDDYVMKVDGREFTIRDLVHSEMVTCQPGSELTFKLIGLSYYLPSDAKWKSQTGTDWDIPRLIREELAQPVIGAACGGTHRLMGFAFAVRVRQKRGEAITGEWARAEKYLEDYHAYTFRLQNSDGTFSTNWFAGRGNSTSAARQVQTTGHILEWLVYSLPKDQLDDPRVLKAAGRLTDLLMSQSPGSWEVGPRGHAVHALVILHNRLFGPPSGGWNSQPLNETASRNVD